MDVAYDAEAAVLGSLLIEPEKLTGEIMNRLTARDFTVPELRHLFDAVTDLFLDGVPIDPVTLVAKAGSNYEKLVRDIMIIVPTAVNWEAYADAVRNHSTLARLQSVALKIATCTDADEALKLMSEASQNTVRRNISQGVSIQEGLEDLIRRMNDKTPPNYLKWGIQPLDERLTADAGDFIVIGADASVGKTALALQLAYSMAASGRRVGIFSLETSSQKAYDRVFSRLADIKLAEIKHKSLSATGKNSLAAQREAIRNLSLTVHPCAGITVPGIRAITLACRYDVIFIDYVQIIQNDGTSRTDIVANISMALHTMAQALGVTVIALSQLTPPDSKTNRFRQNHKEDLRESRQLINDADIIMVMSRTDRDNENYRELVIDKNKEGPLGVVPLDFDPEHMSFSPHKLTRSESYQNAQRACREAARRNALKELPDDDQLQIPEEFAKEGGKC